MTTVIEVQQAPLVDEFAPKTFKRTPLPKFQVFVISFIQFAEPITATIIFPFVVQLVNSTGITGGDELKVGYFAGIIESVFFLMEGLTVYPWSLLSDAYGRRPVLLLGPLGLAFSLFLFGLTTNYYLLVLLRAMQGTCNGIIGVSKTMTAEITDSTNMSLAFSLIPLMWSTGVTTGPLLGGLLANPSERWPLFSHWQFFKDHPFFLACGSAGALAFASFLFGLVGLKESSKIIAAKKRRATRSSTPSSETSSLLRSDSPNYGGTTPQPDEEDEDPAYTLLQLLAVPRFHHILKCYCYLSFSEMAYTCLIPLIYSTSIPNGGLGLEPQQIGVILSAFGLTAAFLNIWVIQPLTQRLGPKRMFVGAMIGLGLAFTTFPLMLTFAQRAGRVDALTIMCMGLQLSFGVSTFAAYASMQVLIVDGSPNPASLASVNSLAQMAACITRVASPTIASSLFSMSISTQLLGGYFVFLVLFGVNSWGVWNAVWLDGELKTLK